MDNNNVNNKYLNNLNMLNNLNCKTFFKIQYCHNTNTYEFQILNQHNKEILYENTFTNVNEINKIIQQHK